MAGADFDLSGEESGNAPNDDGGLMAEDRFGVAGWCRGAAADGDDCVRIEVLSNLVPLDEGVGEPGVEPLVPFWFSLLEVSTLPMWVVRTVLFGELPLQVGEAEVLHRFPLEAPNEERL